MGGWRASRSEVNSSCSAEPAPLPRPARSLHNRCGTAPVTNLLVDLAGGPNLSHYRRSRRVKSCCGCQGTMPSWSGHSIEDRRHRHSYFDGRWYRVQVHRRRGRCRGRYGHGVYRERPLHEHGMVTPFSCEHSSRPREPGVFTFDATLGTAGPQTIWADDTGQPASWASIEDHGYPRGGKRC